MPSFFSILSLLTLLLVASVDRNPLLQRGNCEKHVWRTDPMASLPGTCVGINPISEIEDLKNIHIRNAGDCRALCCNLDTRCTSWQFQNSTKTCYVQKRPFRRGPEGADTPLYVA